MGVLDNPESVVLLRVSEVCRRVGLARGTVYARMAQGAFPRPRVSREACAALAQRRNFRLDCQADGRADRRLIEKRIGKRRPPR